MSGGKITRIIGGKNSIEAKEWIVHTDKFTAYAGKGSYFTADGGTNHGEPEDPPLGKYFEKGFWASDFEGTKKITYAEIGDTVYFHIEMTKDFPYKGYSEDDQKKIYFQVYEFVGYKLTYIDKVYMQSLRKDKNQEIGYVTWDDVNKNNEIDSEEEHTKKPYNSVIVKGNKAILAFQLDKGLNRFFKEDGTDFKLFINFTYHTDCGIDLPIEQENFLSVTPKVKEIYVKLLNYKVSSKVNLALNSIDAIQQFIRGNDDKQSTKVNMDYFSVRIKKMPKLEGGVKQLYKQIMQGFLTLSRGSIYFKGNALVPSSIDLRVNGLWKFVPYPKDNDREYENEQVRQWMNEVGNPIFFIEAGSNDWYAKPIVDHGAVVVSEFDEMCWLFATINTENSDTQPFSGFRQFGIHQDEDGYYRVYTRAIDRIWPSKKTKIANFLDMDATVKDYLSIADGTWKNFTDRVSEFIIHQGGEIEIMEPEIVRTDFHDFLERYDNEPVLHIGNIPQYKYYEK